MWSFFRSPLIQTEQPGNSEHAWPLCAPPWGPQVGRTVVCLSGALRMERRSLKTLPGPETQRPPPQVIRASLWEVRSPLLVCKWGDLRARVGSPSPFPWEGWSGWGLCPFPGNLVNGPALSGHLAFVWGHFCWWSLVQVEAIGSTCLCKSSLGSSVDGQEVNRILWVPLWALCLDSRLVPRELQWALHLFPNTFFHVSLTLLNPGGWGVAAGGKDTVGWEQPLRTTQQGRGGGGTEQVDGDLQSRPAGSWGHRVSP